MLVSNVKIGTNYSCVRRIIHHPNQVNFQVECPCQPNQLPTIDILVYNFGDIITRNHYVTIIQINNTFVIADLAQKYRNLGDFLQILRIILSTTTSNFSPTYSIQYPLTIFLSTLTKTLVLYTRYLILAKVLKVPSHTNATIFH